MITFENRGYWNEKKEKLKQQYPGITDADLYYSDGKERVMLEILSYKLGKTEHEMVRILADL
ncbi:MAG: general stress protein CsbD [Bacteroidales bacterium]